MTTAPIGIMQYANASISVVLAAIIVFLLVKYACSYNAVERLGHGLAGAAVLISVFKQLGFAELVAPFNDWYQLLWRIGWVLLLGGKVWRLEAHRRRNAASVRQAEEYFANKAVRGRA